MKVQCATADLRSATETVARLAGASGYLRIEATTDVLVLEAGAPALQITQSIPAAVSRAGARAVNVRPWVELVRITDAERFGLQTERAAEEIVVRSAAVTTSIRTVAPDVLGLAPPLGPGPRIHVDAGALARAIRDVVFIAAEDRAPYPRSS